MTQLGLVKGIINTRNKQEHTALEANDINKFKRKLDIFIASKCFTHNGLKEKGIKEALEPGGSCGAGTLDKWLFCTLLFLMSHWKNLCFKIIMYSQRNSNSCILETWHTNY